MDSNAAARGRSAASNGVGKVQRMIVFEDSRSDANPGSYTRPGMESPGKSGGNSQNRNAERARRAAQRPPLSRLSCRTDPNGVPSNGNKANRPQIGYDRQINICCSPPSRTGGPGVQSRRAAFELGGEGAAGRKRRCRRGETDDSR